jgi:hypothetical protein
LARVVRERREEHHFLLTAWVFLPDHWHEGKAAESLKNETLRYRLIRSPSRG